MYDSFLYGYGLTLAVFNVLRKIVDTKDASAKHYFDYNDFLKSFLHAKYHKRVLRDFNKYFVLNTETQAAHDEARNFLIANEDEIYSLGFERWFSQHIFTKNDPKLSNVKVYSYILYNYWYHLLYTQVLQDEFSVDLIRRVSQHIRLMIKPEAKVYTTNFDTLFDRFLEPKHLHGIFALPLREMQDVILELDRTKDEFEYIYLFGTNGVEKLHRLNLIRELNQDFYDLDFFFNSNLILGHLLIYGLSFGFNQIMPNDYLDEHPEHKNFHLLRSVDGHIVSRIEALFKHGNVSRVTISYHTDEDFANIRAIFGTTDFSSIVEYKHSAELIDFDGL